MTIRQALAHRPDVIAAPGDHRCGAGIAQSERRSYYPVIEMGAHVFQNMGSVSSDGRPYSSVDRPGSNILFSFSVPLFDGGERASRVSAAQSKVREAEAKLAAVRDDAADQVVKAHNGLITSLAGYEAAMEVGQAAHTAYDAALRSYQQGVGTFTDLATEENAVAQGRGADRGRARRCPQRRRRVGLRHGYIGRRQGQRQPLSTRISIAGPLCPSEGRWTTT